MNQNSNNNNNNNSESVYIQNWWQRTEQDGWNWFWKSTEKLIFHRRIQYWLYYIYFLVISILFTWLQLSAAVEFLRIALKPCIWRHRIASHRTIISLAHVKITICLHGRASSKMSKSTNRYININILYVETARQRLLRVNQLQVRKNPAFQTQMKRNAFTTISLIVFTWKTCWKFFAALAQLKELISPKEHVDWCHSLNVCRTNESKR